MTIETVIGLSMLVLGIAGYGIYSVIDSINWPLIQFCMRKDV